MSLTDHEQARLMALRRYGLLDTLPESIFDSITLAIAKICEVPIALVSLVDANRQWFKSAYGLRARETPRDVAFCSRAIESPDELMIVEDASVDERFADNPLVVGEPNIRFYAGKPLVTSDGFGVGTLCVIDRQPRRLLQHQLDALEALGNTVIALIEERRRLQDVVIDRDCCEQAVRDIADRYQHRYEDAEVMLDSALTKLSDATLLINTDGKITRANDAWNEFARSIGWRGTEVGCNYLHCCEDSTSPRELTGPSVIAGVLRVISGEADRYSVAYSCPKGKCTMSVTQLARPGIGALVQHIVQSPARARADLH